MLPSEDLEDGGFAGAVGPDEEASVAGVEGEGEVVDERLGVRRRVAVDSRVGEFEAVDHDRWIGVLLDAHGLLM